MDFATFQRNALKTESVPEKLTVNPAVMLVLLGAVMDLLKVLDQIKKAAFYGKPIDGEKMDTSLAGVVGAVNFLDWLGSDDLLLSQEPVEGMHAKNTAGEKVPVPVITGDNIRVVHGIIGMLTEDGELIEAFLKALVDGKPINRDVDAERELLNEKAI